MPTTKPKKQLGKMIKASSGNAPTPVKASTGPAAVATPAPKPKPVSVTTGRPAAVWFDDEDRSILRELSVMLLTQGIDPTHSLLVRALLRVAPRDERLIEEVRRLIERDGRKRRHRQPDAQESLA
jgi:hypothetical protein